MISAVLLLKIFWYYYPYSKVEYWTSSPLFNKQTFSFNLF